MKELLQDDVVKWDPQNNSLVEITVKNTLRCFRVAFKPNINGVVLCPNNKNLTSKS
jgi:hypothetical protein